MNECRLEIPTQNLQILCFVRFFYNNATKWFLQLIPVTIQTFLLKLTIQHKQNIVMKKENT